MDLSVVHRIMEMEKSASEDNAALGNEQVNPFLLKSILDKNLGVDWINWLPETIRSEAIMPQVNMEKAMAIKAVIKNPDTQDDVDAFENCCTAFNNEIPIWGVVEPLTSRELCWGSMVIRSLNPMFVASERVLAYCFACMEEDGLIWNPWLDITVTGDHTKSLWHLSTIENAVKSKWNIIKSMPVDRLLNVEFQDEDAVEQQLEKLVNIRVYIEAMLQ